MNSKKIDELMEESIQILKSIFFENNDSYENLIQSFFDKIGEILLEIVKTQANIDNIELKSYYDEILFIKDCNKVQTETNPSDQKDHYYIAISNGEFCLSLRMCQLLSLKLLISLEKNSIIEKPRISLHNLKQIFNKICNLNIKKENANWNFSIFKNKKVQLDDNTEFLFLFLASLTLAIGHEFGEIFHRDFQDKFREKEKQIEDFINSYYNDNNILSKIDTVNLEKFKKEILSDYFGWNFVLKLFKNTVSLKFANLASVIHFFIKDLCDQWVINKFPNHSYIEDIQVGFYPDINYSRTQPRLREHPPNKLRLDYLISLTPGNIQDLIMELREKTKQFFQ